MIRTILRASVPAFLAIAFFIQFIPYGVSNPPVSQEPAWTSARVEELTKRACYDCHSNEVNVPWYGHVAPVSWVVRHHVDEGRAALNFSEMDKPQKEAHEAGEELLEGEMPPGYYTAMHATARLTESEVQELAAGLDAMLGGDV